MWLALCAGVLRRAVSHSAQPRLRSATSSVTVGRSELAPPQRTSPIKRFGKGNENLHISGFNWRHANQAARPNWSLNRTLCGGPGLGFKSLAQTRPTAKCRLASTLGITAERNATRSSRLAQGASPPKYNRSSEGGTSEMSQFQKQSVAVGFCSPRTNIPATLNVCWQLKHSSYARLQA